MVGGGRREELRTIGRAYGLIACAKMLKPKPKLTSILAR